MLNREEVLKDIPNRIGSDIKIQFRPILLEAAGILVLCQISPIYIVCWVLTLNTEYTKKTLNMIWSDSVKVWSKLCQIVKRNIKAKMKKRMNGD